MTFQKVVKAPSKLANIGNYRRQAAERERKKMEWTLNYINILTSMLIYPDELDKRLDAYQSLRKTILELKTYRCFVGFEHRQPIVDAKFEFIRKSTWFMP